MFFYVYYFIYFVYHKVPSWLWRLDHKIQFIKHMLYSIIPELCLQFSCESLSISSHVQLHSFTVLISTHMLDFFSARPPSHTGDTISFRNLIKYQKENINIHICIPYFSSSMNICPVIVINTNTGNIKLFTIWLQPPISASFLTSRIYQSSSLWVYNPEAKDIIHAGLSLCPH